MYYLLSGVVLGGSAMFVILMAFFQKYWRRQVADIRKYGDFGALGKEKTTKEALWQAVTLSPVYPKVYKRMITFATLAKDEYDAENLALIEGFSLYLLRTDVDILLRMQAYDAMHVEHRRLFLGKFGPKFWKSVLPEITGEGDPDRLRWHLVRRNAWDMQQYAPESWLKLQQQCAQLGLYSYLRDMFPHQAIPAELLEQTKSALVQKICHEHSASEAQCRELLDILVASQDFTTIGEIIEKLEGKEVRGAYLIALQDGNKLSIAGS